MPRPAESCHTDGMRLPCVIVDDNESFLEVARSVLERQGMAVVAIFCAFTTLKTTAVKPIAVSFAVGVAIDAFVVRLTLVSGCPTTAVTLDG
jgi:hypothetical protein